MDIVIPTYRRPASQWTYRKLKEAGRAPVLVIREDDLGSYLRYIPRQDLHVIEKPVTNIGETRDYIIHDMQGYDSVLMLDDDLDFAVRRLDEPTKFRDATEKDIVNMLIVLEELLQCHFHVSIAPREGANRNTQDLLYNTRMMRVLGYNRAFLKEHCLTFAPTNFMCDFHMTLQILKLGQVCVVQNEFVSNQRGGSNAPGGCSTQRSEAAQSAEAHLLAGLHPPFVKVVQKPSWSGVGMRDDVVIQWKKAYEAGCLE